MARIPVVLTLLLAGVMQAQVPSGAGTVLAEMASHASVVFAGQVVAVDRNDAAGFVDIRFHIMQAVRGCPQRGSYVLREWAGLWIGHPERYRVGQRRLMLLTARSAAGMSSPVGGLDGAIPLVAAGAEPLAHGSGVAPADSGKGIAGYAADLRWIQARGLRGSTVVAPASEARIVAIGTPARPAPDGAAVDWVGPIAPLNGSSAAALPPVSLGSVLALIGSSPHAVSGVRNARY